MWLGIAGFFVPFGMRFFGKFLDQVELPNSLGAFRIAAPDGRVFIVSEPLLRVQRYGPSGFERGFAIDPGSKSFNVGISQSGDLLICSEHAPGLITYSPDGVEVGMRAPCTYNTAIVHFELSTGGHAQVPAIAFNWFAVMAVPLWHPVMGWLVALAAGLFLKFRPRPALSES